MPTSNKRSQRLLEKVMFDLYEGKLEPHVAREMTKSAGQLIRAVESELKYKMGLRKGHIGQIDFFEPEPVNPEDEANEVINKAKRKPATQS